MVLITLRYCTLQYLYDISYIIHTHCIFILNSASYENHAVDVMRRRYKRRYLIELIRHYINPLEIKHEYSRIFSRLENVEKKKIMPSLSKNLNKINKKYKNGRKYILDFCSNE